MLYRNQTPEHLQLQYSPSQDGYLRDLPEKRLPVSLDSQPVRELSAFDCVLVEELRIHHPEAEDEDGKRELVSAVD